MFAGLDERPVVTPASPYTSTVPSRLKTGVEALSGISMDSVKVHYNSPEPARVEALAYTQGTDIHVAPGQEKHLAHEAWHVVQQRQGRVRPTMQLAGTAINDDSSLEREADSMGALALAGEGSLGQRRPAIQSAELSTAKGAQSTGFTAPGQLQRGTVQRTTIRQPGYASGDMFGIAAALIIDPDLKVVITTENRNPKSDQTDVGEKIFAYYSSFLPRRQIRLVRVSSIRTTKDRDENWWNDELVREAVRELEGGRSDRWESVEFATQYIAENWPRRNDRQKAFRQEIRGAWNIDTSADDAIRDWLNDKGIRPEEKKIAILWSRFSGKKGDVHLEHDTSFTGMHQLIRAALTSGNNLVIIAGDKPIPRHDKPQRAVKYDDMANEPGFRGKVFNLTGFWEESPQWCRTRNDQFKLYDYLDRTATTVKHLGFRSGNLEAFALMGHRVRYLEEPGSKGGGRMAQWHRTGIGYERITVGQVPTASGKYLKKIMGQYAPNERLPERVMRPLWAPGRGVEPKPAGIERDPERYWKGFRQKDLQGPIREYLES